MTETITRSAFFKACKDDQHDIVKSFLKSQKDRGKAYQHDLDLAMKEAITYGRGEIVKIILPYLPWAAATPEFKTRSHIFMFLAAQLGKVDIIEVLLPCTNVKLQESEALRKAAEYGRLEAVKFLLPHSNPAAADSGALRYAVLNNRWDIVDLLWDVSEPEKALERMKKEAHWRPAVLLFEQRILSEQSKQGLEEGLSMVIDKKALGTPKPKL